MQLLDLDCKVVGPVGAVVAENIAAEGVVVVVSEVACKDYLYSR
jgi:hypothetical protein